MTIEANDIFDIFLLSYLLYRILLVLKGTRAYQSLIGLFVLLMLYAGSQYFELYSIVWLLDKFFVYFVLAIIILFQEDIRKGLARAGSLFPSMRKEETPIFEELNKVSFLLAKRRIGALIAIEKKASLSEFVENGTQLDSIISQDLLRAIFLPNSPLHDGAVIIQNGRIAAAQTFLPLSSSKMIPKIYGTRHRAAIGLTEGTDAIVIVVSEERGTVGIVQKGQILVVRDENEMRQVIFEAMQKDKDEEADHESA
jgi:diadenylate cyclase